MMKKKIIDKDITSAQKLEVAIHEVWDSLDSTLLQHLDDSIPRGLKVCLKANGHYIKY